jgi:hypothetical protein
VTHEQHAPEGSDDATPTPRPARRSPFGLDALVPKPLADRGRAALESIETAKSTLDTARANALDLGRKLRSPGGLLGPLPPPPGLPSAPAHPLHRTQAEIAALLPRDLDLPVPQAQGAVQALGWTGDLYLLGDDTPRSIIRRYMPKPVSAPQAAVGLLATVLDANVAEPENLAVELLDPDGHPLLLSAPSWQRRPDGSRTTRTVTLPDGTPVAEITQENRKSRTRHVLPAPTLRTTSATTDLRDLSPATPTTARVWRGPHELAAIRTENGKRRLTITSTTTDDEALLTWAAALSWWGGF